MMRAPGFWWREVGWSARALAPVAALYGAIAGRRMDRGVRAEADLPVVCVGNLTLGGGGKTPTCLALATAARGLSLRPGFLTRGYGGRERAAVLVDPAWHDARAVGDEAMLLAAAAPTAVSRDRLAGARLLREVGCDLAIMDDGFQSARLRCDLALVVVDGARGVGNGRVFPAGPLRAPLATQLRHADAILTVGAGSNARPAFAAPKLPIFAAEVVSPNGAEFAGVRVLAFSGIADPGKFHRSLRTAGAEIVAHSDYPDHHVFGADDARSLLQEADSLGARLVTTAKDAQRLHAAPAGVVRALAERTSVLSHELRFAGEGDAAAILRRALDAYAARGAGA